MCKILCLVFFKTCQRRYYLKSDTSFNRCKRGGVHYYRLLALVARQSAALNPATKHVSKIVWFVGTDTLRE